MQTLNKYFSLWRLLLLYFGYFWFFISAIILLLIIRSKRMKTAKIKLSKTTNANYILTMENSQYSIICIEECLNDGTSKIYKASCITSSRALAKHIFKLVVRGKVFGVTLSDVIYNLID